MRFFTLAVIGLAWGYGVFWDGGVPPREWNWSLGVIAVAALLHFLAQRRTTLRRPLDSVSGWLLGIFCALALLPVAPLPAGVIRVLSPMRYEMLQAAKPELGSIPYATLSATPDASWPWLATIAGCVLVFLVLRDLAWRFEPLVWLPAAPILVVATFEAILGLVQFYSENSEGLARGTYANRNHFAGLLEMALPFAAMQAIAILKKNRDRFHSPAGPTLKACALLAVAAVLLVAVVHSLSRMGFLATLGALFIMGSLALSGGLSGWKRWIPVALIGAAVLACFIFLPLDPLIARFAELAAGDEISSDTRAILWRDTRHLIGAFPLTGCGPGSYESCFMRFKTVAPMNTADYAHNDYLQIMAEVGIPAFLIGLAFILRIFWRGIRVAESEAGPDERYLGLACTGSLTAILLHSFVDYNLYVPANAMLLAWVLGITARSLAGRGPARRPARAAQDSGRAVQEA